jgi:hypothetical protein
LLQVGCFPLPDDEPNCGRGPGGAEHAEQWCDYVPNLKSYWRDYLKHLGLTDAVRPFLHLVGSWYDVPAYVKGQRADPVRLEALRQEMVQWYRGFKRALSQRVAATVRGRVAQQPAYEQGRRLGVS